ncbi:hypothetical protein WICPIJ_006892, partial [Wickerhamomyces pijperi]
MLRDLRNASDVDSAGSFAGKQLNKNEADGKYFTPLKSYQIPPEIHLITSKMMLRSHLRETPLLRTIRFSFKSTRLNHTKPTWDHDPQEPLTLDKSLITDTSSLPFNYLRGGEAFGQIVKDQHHDLNEINESKIKVIDREEILAQHELEDVTINEKLLTSQDERLHPLTLKARTYRPQIHIPEYLSKAIYNHMIGLHLPKTLRYEIAETYVKLNDEQIYKPTIKKHEVDSQIGAYFTQNYASTYQCLQELMKRRPDFKPESVLDVGFGPSVGMLALNEVMGHEFAPAVKDSVIIGHERMAERAKILLSRQVPEYVGDISEITVEEEEDKEETADFIGEVKTNKIKIKTKLHDRLSSLRSTRKYDLIIAQHQLLSDPKQFPLQIDDNLDELLKRLSPRGVLVLVERGTPLGFESIARARQIMLRPENFTDEHGLIPRPYMKGSISEIEDAELLTGYEIVEDTFKNDYHLSVVAPCTHHGVCPLQTSKPAYYEYPAGKKKLNWCSYEKSVERPRFLMELKRGKVLSSRWELEDVVSPTSRHRKGGDSGRIGANNYELTNFSYLIMERSANDKKTIKKITEQRESAKTQTPAPSEEETTSGRIIKQPLKRKGHVTMALC